MSQQDAHDAFTQTYSTLDDLAADRARRQSANALAAGDGTGARNALLRRGLTADANALEDRGWQRQQHDLEAAQGRLKLFGQVIQSTQAVPLEKRPDYVEYEVKPLLLKMGFPSDQVAAIDDSHLTDDSLAAIHALVSGESPTPDPRMIQTGRGGALGVDPRTGKVAWTLSPQQAQAANGFQWTPDGQAQQPIPGGPYSLDYKKAVSDLRAAYGPLGGHGHGRGRRGRR